MPKARKRRGVFHTVKTSAHETYPVSWFSVVLWSFGSCLLIAAVSFGLRILEHTLKPALASAATA